jgi:high affinity Mn2+ porin
VDAGGKSLTEPLPQYGSSPNCSEAAIEKFDDFNEQAWNWHIQNTDIIQGDPRFPAKYSGSNSLNRHGEIRDTVSLDLFAGARLWRWAEVHVDGMMWQGFGLSDALGVEGFPNGEAIKSGTEIPNFTFARLFLRQTIGFGGEQENVPDDQLTLAGKQDISRLTFTIGRFSPTDIFDKNTYAGDPRTQFMNWALMANAAWDFPADTVGYTTGLAIELNQPQWALRYGFFQMPALKNGWTAEDRFLKIPSENSAGDGEFWRSWGMVAEFERRYHINTHPGAIRFLAYLNQADMASYKAACSILESSGPGADISPARAYRNKYGFGLNWEQEVAANVGMFSRVGWNDGRNEGWTFTDTDYSASLGLSVKGEAWHRPNDTLGLVGVANGASRANQKFLEAGGTDILSGDGALNYGWEKILETYYDFKIWKTLHVTVDYQFITNPAFNRDRGPVCVFGARLHWEF